MDNKYDKIDSTNSNLLYGPMLYPLYPKYSALLTQTNTALENEISNVISDKKHGVDVIFVHGLRGSLFKTWRFKESKNTNDTRNEHNNKLNHSKIIKSLTNFSKENKDSLIGKLNNFIENHATQSNLSTECFPNDWLPENFNENDSVRIIGVNYDTLYTLWGEDLIDDKKLTFSIKQRAIDLLEQLKLAQVGENNRSVIFVCHSMGGNNEVLSLFLNSYF